LWGGGVKADTKNVKKTAFDLHGEMGEGIGG